MSELSAESLVKAFEKADPGAKLPPEAVITLVRAQIISVDDELSRLNGCKEEFNSIDFHDEQLHNRVLVYKLGHDNKSLRKTVWRVSNTLACLDTSAPEYKGANKDLFFRRCGGICRKYNIAGIISDGSPESNKVQEHVRVKIEELLTRRRKLDEVLSKNIDQLVDSFE